ncbi:MAG TPA: DnaJ domain-containing protein [Polyangiaceae bacterium]|nr:DnaJ domain-containing protein [Polyangiaceae bacterium]
MSEHVPEVVGTLESTPFGQLLVHALDHRLTGTLVLEETGGTRHGIYLEGGTPKKAKISAPVGFLGDVLLDAGAITRDVHARALERSQREHVLFGQLLLDEGVISERTLGLGLREHLSRKLVWLFAQPLDTQYGYFDGENFLANWGAASGAEPSTLEVLWRGLREHARPSELEAALKRVAGLKLALRPGLPANHFAFMGDDRQIVGLLAQGPRRLSELIDAAPALADSIQRVLYFLVLTRSVDLGLPSAPPVGVGAEPFVGPTSARVPSFTNEVQSPAAEPEAPLVPVRRDSPPSIPPAVVHGVALREELRKRAEHRMRTHYDVLGIPPNAPPRQIQSAFFVLSKRWHPDRLSAETPEAREAATRVFESISRAYHVLADPATRAVYDGELRSGASEDATPSIEHALSADLAFQKAEAFLARGNLEGAEREARLALGYDPERGEFIALAAWLAALKPDGDQRRIAADLARAVRRAEQNVKVHWYRGLFLKRVGRHASALQEFRYVVERDPRHIDAAREVRIYEQRLKNSPKDRPTLAPEADSPPSSTWSRLFKRRT